MSARCQRFRRRLDCVDKRGQLSRPERACSKEVGFLGRRLGRLLSERLDRVVSSERKFWRDKSVWASGGQIGTGSRRDAPLARLDDLSWHLLVKFISSTQSSKHPRWKQLPRVDRRWWTRLTFRVQRHLCTWRERPTKRVGCFNGGQPTPRQQPICGCYWRRLLWWLRTRFRAQQLGLGPRFDLHFEFTWTRRRTWNKSDAHDKYLWQPFGHDLKFVDSQSSPQGEWSVDAAPKCQEYLLPSANSQWRKFLHPRSSGPWIFFQK